MTSTSCTRSHVATTIFKNTKKIPLKPPYVVAIEKTLNEECNLFKFFGQIFSFCQIRHVCIDAEQVHDVGTVFFGICKILDNSSRK